MNVNPELRVPPVGSIIKIVGLYPRSKGSRYMTFMGLPRDFNNASVHSVVAVNHDTPALVVATDVDATFDWGKKPVVIMYVKDENDVWQYITVKHGQFDGWHDHAVFVPH